VEQSMLCFLDTCIFRLNIWKSRRGYKWFLWGECWWTVLKRYIL